MSPEELKALLEKAVKDINILTAKNQELETKAQELETKLTAAPDEAKYNEIQDEISDLRSKMKSPASAINTKEQKEAVQDVIMKCVGSFVKTQDRTLDFFKYIEEEATTRCKTLNITAPESGGLAIVSTLSHDVMDYARDLSPILELVGRKSSLTRDYSQLIKVTYPSVTEGIENVAGTVPAETSTQTYLDVKSKVFKLMAQPRITNEALFGTDIDVYGDLITSLGEEIGIYLAAQIMFGDGLTKNCRGILSSKRVDVTNLTGESFKKTLTPDGTGARDPDFFPVYATGVSAAIGTDDAAIVDFVIKSMAKLPKRYRKNAKWTMNENTKTIFELVRNSQGDPIFRPDYRTGGFSLNGKPVVIDDTWPDLATDSIFAMYGDLSQAFVINDGDIDQLLLDPYTVKGNLVVYTEKEYFEMVQRSDAVLMMCATTNAAA